ncbi:MAG: hypothetical protein IKF56_02470 [Eggerthellaceae bacterium]|nr:hypothetical protein [Eggerthellaceae bacterium]
MLDMTFVLESLRRRWWVAVLVAVVFCAAGLAGMVMQKSDAISPTYTAEAAFYVSYDDTKANAGDLDVSLEEDEYLAYDARRVVLNDSVAGEVRRALGEDVVISTPAWQNDLTKVENKTRFIFVDATAGTEEKALQAADMAADLAVQRINDDFEGITAFASDAAVIRTSSGGVANFGADALTASPITQAASSISVKRLIIFAGAGLIVGIACIIIVEYCRRRIRSAHDVERLLGVNVIETLDSNSATVESYRRFGGILDALAKQRDAKSICLIGWPAEETPTGIVKNLDANLQYAGISGWAGMSSCSNSASALAESDSAVLVMTRNEQSAHELDEFAKAVSAVGLDVLGALYLER